MNAAKAKKSPAKVKGAVLIMILAVMTVMIILLAGSIAVVYSAHNRASVKYSESQGYYTARSVLDNFFSELSRSGETEDPVTHAKFGKYYSLSDSGTNPVKDQDIKLGRLVELDLYKASLDGKSGSDYADWVKEYCDNNADGLKAQILQFNPSASLSSSTDLYSNFVKYYVNLDTGSLTDYSTYDKYYNQYKSMNIPDGDTLTYELSSLEGFGSGTIDTDGDGNPDTKDQFGKLADDGTSKAWITVKVTERIFDMGEGTTYADRIKNGKRSDDHIVAIVTSHVIYNGEEITTSQMWYNNPPPIVDSNAGLPSLGPINDAASMTGIGDVATLTRELSKFRNDPTFSGNVYFEGSLEHNSNKETATMSEGEVFFVGDTYISSESCFQGVNTGSIFYADRFQLWKQNSLTDGDVPVNIIANKFETHSDQKKVYGRIFAETFDTMSSGAEQTYPDSNKQLLISNGSMVFSANNTQIYGDVYCNYLGVPADRVCAKVDASAGTITFNINYNGQNNELAPGDTNRIETMMASGKKIYVYKGIRIINGVVEQPVAKDASGNDVKRLVNRYETYWNGSDSFTDFTIGEKFTIPESGSLLQIYGDPVQIGVDYTIKVNWSNTDGVIVDKSGSSEKLKLDYYAPASEKVWTLNANTYQKEFKLPSGVNLLGSNGGEGKDEFSLPTHRSIYKNYFFTEITGGTTGAAYPKTFDDDTGSFTMPSTDPDFQTFLQEHAITAEALYSQVDTSTAVDIDNVPDLPFLTSEATAAPGGGDTVNGVYMPASSYVISSSGYVVGPSDPNQYNSYKSRLFYIDARSGDLEIQLGDGISNRPYVGGFVVYGTGHVTVLVPGVNGGGDNQTVSFGDGSQGGMFIFDTEEIFSGLSKYKFYIGQDPNNRSQRLTPAPNIDWYFSKNISTVNVINQGSINGAPAESNKTHLVGYITAPSAHFEINTSLDGIRRDTYYYGTRITPSSNEQYLICGSVFCRSYKGGQHAGVCFIPRDSVYVDDGGPMLNPKGMYRGRTY